MVFDMWWISLLACQDLAHGKLHPTPQLSKQGRCRGTKNCGAGWRHAKYLGEVGLQGALSVLNTMLTRDDQEVHLRLVGHGYRRICRI